MRRLYRDRRLRSGGRGVCRSGSYACDYDDPGDGSSAGIADQAAQSASYFVAEQIVHATGAFGQGRRRLHFADVARRQHQRIGTADNVGERMNLCGPAAPGSPDRLRRAPPFAPNAARWILMYVLSIAVLLVTTPASTSAASNCTQKPRCDQRLKRL